MASLRKKVKSKRAQKRSKPRVPIHVRATGELSDSCVERDPRFLRTVSNARVEIAAGKGVRLEDL